MTETGTDDAQEASSMWQFDRHSEGRSLILWGIGAVLGLAAAGTALFTAQGTRTSSVAPQDVAVVNGVPILKSDYIVELKGLYGNITLSQATPQQKHKILNDMISKELLVQRGIELGLQNDIIEVRNALADAVDTQEALDVLAAMPTDQQLRAFYNQHRSNYASAGSMMVSDYVAPSLEAARLAVADFRRNPDSPTVAASHKLKDSGAIKDGNEFYFAAKIHLGAKLFSAASALASGQVSDPIQTPTGIHILVMHHNAPPVAQPYDAVRDKVLEDIRQDKIARVTAGANRFLRKRAEIHIAKAFQ